MTIDSAIVLLILIVSIILFATDKLRADIVALLVLLALILTNILTVDEAFAGFSSPAVITVWAVFILSGGLTRSGFADILARNILKLGGNSERRILIIIMVASGVMSSFMNNIGAVAILLPVVISIGRTLGISPSKLLMPLAFAALLGGNITLIGTPPNILAVDIMQTRGIEPFRFFDFAPTGIIALVIGILYIIVFGKWLLPNRTAQGELTDVYSVRNFLFEVKVGTNSELIGKRLRRTNLTTTHNLSILYVRPNDAEVISPLRNYRIKETDTLLFKGTLKDVFAACQDLSLTLKQDWDASQWSPDELSDKLHLAEITLTPNSSFAGLTLDQISFRKRYGLSVLAVRHKGEDIVDYLANMRIELGDSLLVQGSTERVNFLINDPNVLLLERPNLELRRIQKAPYALVIFLTVLVTAAFGIFDVSALMLTGAIAMVLTGVLTMDEAYRSIDWKAVFLIAGMLPMGEAMEKTGSAQYMADQLVAFTGDFSTYAVLACVFLLTAALTSIISNAATTVLIVPIAINIALNLGVDPRPFIMTTILAASTSFLTPVGHQVNIVILGAGGYKFLDYTRVGIGLTILMLLICLTVVPMIWQF